MLALFFRQLFVDHENHIQMCHQCLFRALSITPVEGVDNRQMLLDHGGQALGFRPVTMEPRERHLGGKDCLPDALAAGKRAEQPVKRLVRMKEARCVIGGDHPFLLGDDIPHRPAHLFRPPRRNLSQQGDFERTADKMAVLNFAKPDRRDEAAELRIDIHKPLFRQALDGGAHRRA